MHIALGWLVLAAGIAGLLAAWVLRRQRLGRTLAVDRGGVVVGHDNSGSINTGTINTAQVQTHNAKGGRGSKLLDRFLNIAGSLCSIYGLYLVFYPPK